MSNEDFNVKDFLEKLKHVFQHIFRNTKFEKAFKELEEDLNKNIPSEKDLKKYGFSGEQGRLKKRIFEYAYEDWKLKKDPKKLKKLLSIVIILLESLSHLGSIFEAANELVKLFKLDLGKTSKVKHVQNYL